MRLWDYRLLKVLPKEEWKQYKNTNYEVSSLGNVRNINGRIKSQQLDRYGYLVTDLYIEGKRKTTGGYHWKKGVEYNASLAL